MCVCKRERESKMRTYGSEFPEIPPKTLQFSRHKSPRLLKHTEYLCTYSMFMDPCVYACTCNCPHLCTPAFVRTINNTMQSLVSYPNFNHHNYT